MVDHILSQEDENFEEFVYSMQVQGQDNDPDAPDYGSDDDEYDKLFTVIMSTQILNAGKSEKAPKADWPGDSNMDFS